MCGPGGHLDQGGRWMCVLGGGGVQLGHKNLKQCCIDVPSHERNWTPEGTDCASGNVKPYQPGRPRVALFDDPLTQTAGDDMYKCTYFFFFIFFLIPCL